MSPTTRTLLFALTVLSTTALAHGNLLTNGGAEAGNLSSWTHTGAIASTGINQTMGHVAPYEGNWFFSIHTNVGGGGAMSQGGTTGMSADQLILTGMVQTEDLKYGDGIGEYAEILLTILDFEDSPIAMASTPIIRTRNLQWVPFQVVLDVPQNADHWDVNLTGTMQEGSYVNVFFDSVSLTPEPATLILSAAGLPFLLKRKRNRQ
ncbi:MAG: PEP-CTERM sorting domain-containing protein [Phycisphaerae bacterium]|jgi:hypothetical protein|nr:PEP-CTERM sorting domain-containing protein [Phycisphaerae bacterium]